MTGRLSRRGLLRGLGVTVALPWLESLAPKRAWAQASSDTCRRLVALFAPNGLQPDRLRPSAVGPDFPLPRGLEAMASLRDQLTLVSGLAHTAAIENEDGDHIRGTGTFLTCTRLPQGEGPLDNGPSLDQVLVQATNPATRFPSLQLGLEARGSTGLCDADYACAYDQCISWTEGNTPLPKIIDPRLLFERLFASRDERESAVEAGRRRLERRSVLDAVLGDADALAAKVSARDRWKLDEYLTGVRELERLVESEGVAGQCAAVAPDSQASVDVTRRAAAMNALIVAALTCDRTRFVTHMLGESTSGRAYPFLGVKEAHHELSHHGGDEETLQKLDRIVAWELGQLADLAARLSRVEEEDGTLLDRTVLLLSSDVMDGNRHNHDDQWVILAGGRRGGLATGQHLHFGGAEPLANLYLTLLEAFGVQRANFGDDGDRILGPLRSPA